MQKCVDTDSKILLAVSTKIREADTLDSTCYIKVLSPHAKYEGTTSRIFQNGESGNHLLTNDVPKILNKESN